MGFGGRFLGGNHPRHEWGQKGVRARGGGGEGKKKGGRSFFVFWPAEEEERERDAPFGRQGSRQSGRWRAQRVGEGPRDPPPWGARRNPAWRFKFSGAKGKAERERESGKERRKERRKAKRRRIRKEGNLRGDGPTRGSAHPKLEGRKQFAEILNWRELSLGFNSNCIFELK